MLTTETGPGASSFFNGQSIEYRPPLVMLHQSPPLSNEQRLWAAVLQQAVADAGGRKPKGNTRNDRRVVMDSARYWFARKGRGVGSFLWVCEALGLDPDALRPKIRGAWDAGHKREKGRKKRGFVS